MSIAQNIAALKEQVPPHVRIVAVSKTKPIEDIMEAYKAGQRIFGENKVQEMIAKQPGLPEDIRWHMIGHLQTNKVKYIAPYVSLIESVDSLKLLKEINKQAGKNGRIIDCLLQFHIASEETKFGLDPDEAMQILDSEDYNTMENISIAGVMGMGTFTDDEIILRKEFSTLKNIYEELKASHFKGDEAFREISMGMTGDYMIAIEEGSTMVRIGTGIFGARTYH
jgi:pyridoxal phosphate enzyme (YggS family)